MTLEIWQDIGTRLRNLRADIVGQWQGDMDNLAIEHTVMGLGAAIQRWNDARPFVPQPPTPTGPTTSTDDTPFA